MTNITTILSEADERFESVVSFSHTFYIREPWRSCPIANKEVGETVNIWGKCNCGAVKQKKLAKDFLHSEIKRAVEGTQEEMKNKVYNLYQSKYSHFTRDYTKVDQFRDDVIDLLSTLTSSNKEDKV